MKRFIARILTLAAVALMGVPHAGASNRIVISNAEGLPDAEVKVTVSLESDVPIAALQVSAELGDAAIAVNGTAVPLGRAANHAASCGTKDGVTTLMLYSTTMASIAAGSGEVAEFTLRLGKRPANAVPSLVVKATDASGREVACSGSGLSVKVLGATATYPSGPAYDFGRVAIRDTYTLSIPVENSGTSPLVIDGVEFSSEDFSCVSELPLTVEAGSIGALVVGYAPLERGDISVTAKVMSNSTMPDNVLRLLAQPFAVNEVHVGSVSGVSDTEVTVPITVNNMDAVTGFTFEFELPSQLQYVDGSFALSQRSEGHSVVASVNNGKLIATAYSLTDAPFADEDGEIASFKVRLSGRNSVTLNAQKAVLSAVIGGKVTDVTSAIYSGSVSILYPQIDAYSSISLGRTPITEDAATTLQIRNYGTAPLRVERIVCDGVELTLDREVPFEVAPSYSSETVTFTCSGKTEGTLSGTLHIYSNDPDQRLLDVAVGGERYAPNFITLKPELPEFVNGKCALNLVLDNYDAISGLQFDVTLPEGFEPEEPVMLGRAAGFTTIYNKVNSATVRYFVYSLGGADIEQGKGNVMQLLFTYSEDIPVGSYTFVANGLKLSNQQMANRSSVIGDVVAMVDVRDMPESATVSVGADGLATYCPAYNLDFSEARDIAAYKATISDNTAILTRVETVAAGEGVLLRSFAEGAATEDIPTIADATRNEENAFVGTTEAMVLYEKAGSVTNFVLSKVDGVVGFFKAKPEADGGTSVGAWKAYLPVENYNPEAAIKGISFIFVDATGISDVIVQPSTEDDAFYTLSGIRVKNPMKGIYIKNGKKVVVK